MVFGVVYRIRCNITGDDYYGSTLDFYQRQSDHRSRNTTASEIIIQRGNWTMTVVEIVEESIMRQRENYYIIFYPCVNKKKAVADKDYNKLAKHDFYNKHKERVLEQVKRWRENHKEQTLEMLKQYRETHRKEHRLHASQKFNCECGGKYTNGHKSRHLKTPRHQAFLKM